MAKELELRSSGNYHYAYIHIGNTRFLRFISYYPGGKDLGSQIVV